MAWDSYLEKNQDRFVEELRSFISIPSVSAADEHFEDVVKAGEWVASKLQSIGISNARLMKTQRTLLFMATGYMLGKINQLY